jgi:hypothetical protein
MTAAAAGTAALLGAGLSPKGLFLALSAANLVLAGLSRWQARRFA